MLKVKDAVSGYTDEKLMWLIWQNQAVNKCGNNLGNSTDNKLSVWGMAVYNYTVYVIICEYFC